MSVVVLPSEHGVTRGAVELAARWSAAGYPARIAEVPWGGLSVTAGTREVEAARDAIDDGAAIGAVADAAGDALILVGLGYGGLAARLGAASCASVAVVIDIGGRLAYRTLSSRKPIQPMDTLLGLTAALQVHVAGRDPLVTPLHVQELDARLAAHGRPRQVCRYPDAGLGFIDPELAGYDPPSCETAWARMLAFARHVSPPGAP